MKIFQVTHTVSCDSYVTTGSYHFTNLPAAQQFVFELWQQNEDLELDKKALEPYETLTFIQRGKGHKVTINEFTVYEHAWDCQMERL